MSVEAKLFVTCGKEKLFEVGNAVTEALNKYSRDKLDEYLNDNDLGFTNRFNYIKHQNESQTDFKFSNGVKITMFDFNIISFVFGSGDESMRNLSMISHCFNDYKDTFVGDKIIFSLGCWGKSDEIMMVVANAVKEFGDVYYDHKDCDDEDFVKLF